MCNICNIFPGNMLREWHLRTLWERILPCHLCLPSAWPSEGTSRPQRWSLHDIKFSNGYVNSPFLAEDQDRLGDGVCLQFPVQLDVAVWPHSPLSPINCAVLFGCHQYFGQELGKSTFRCLNKWLSVKVKSYSAGTTMQHKVLMTGGYLLLTSQLLDYMIVLCTLRNISLSD